MTSFVIYKGPSLIDGQPIVAIAQVKTGNRKTGDMVQTWIMHAEVNPVEASRIGADRSVCGDCPHRGTPQPEATRGQAKGRTCYVNLIFAPNQIYKAYRGGAYPHARGHEQISSIGEGLGVRLGSYGDPLAIPFYVWASLISRAEYVTAYTHLENRMPKHIMTSADSLLEAQSAWDRGERTFRVVSDASAVIRSKEVLCPASEEAGERVQCSQCKLCGGTSIRGKSVAIVAHGTGRKRAKELVA